MTTGSSEEWGNHLRELERGALHRFFDWEMNQLPNWKAGVYTIWAGDDFLYAGMGGRGLTTEAQAARDGGRRKGLLDRLHSHASGRRSGDQFCIYVFDRLLLPSLSRDEIEGGASGRLSLDAKVRGYVRERLGYRYVVVSDSREAANLERMVRRNGLSGTRPRLNPLVTLHQADEPGE